MRQISSCLGAVSNKVMMAGSESSTGHPPRTGRSLFGRRLFEVCGSKHRWQRRETRVIEMNHFFKHSSDRDPPNHRTLQSMIGLVAVGALLFGSREWRTRHCFEDDRTYRCPERRVIR